MAGKEMITVADYASAEFIEKKSRFIGHIAPAGDEKEAQQFLERIRAEHKAANHNCYAWVCGENDSQQRSSDMGEPSGTAGRPILEAIKRADLHNTVVVVTRYFGGIKLGTGGLVRAYTSSAKLALEAAGKHTVKDVTRMNVTIPYTLLGKLQNLKRSEPFAIDDIIYQDNVTLSLSMDLELEDRIKALLMEISSGSAIIESIDHVIE